MENRKYQPLHLTTVTLFCLLTATVSLFAQAQTAGPQPHPATLSISKPSETVRKAGSLIIYRRYKSSALPSDCDDTDFSLTNAHPSEEARVRLLFVRQSDRRTEEYSVCIAAGRTVRWSAGEMDPGESGFVMAIACDALWQPAQFNWLKGEFTVREKKGSDIAEKAVALARQTSGSDTLLFIDRDISSRLPGSIIAFLRGITARLSSAEIRCEAGSGFNLISKPGAR